MAENYEHIEKYKRLAKKTKKIIDTTKLHHTGAYTQSAEKVLKDEDGLMDYNRFKLPEYQSAMAEEMSDYLVGKAEKVLKIKIKKRDEAEKAMLMNAYAGVTKEELKHYLRQYKNRFTLDLYEAEIKPEFMKKIAHSLSGVASHHFKDEHIDDIVRYIGIGNLVDTKYMQLQDAIHLLARHTDLGTVPEKELEDRIYYTKRKEAVEKTRAEIKKSELEKKAS